MTALDKLNNDLHLFDQAMPCNLQGVANSLANHCGNLKQEGYSTDKINSCPQIREYIKNMAYMVGLDCN